MEKADLFEEEPLLRRCQSLMMKYCACAINTIWKDISALVKSNWFRGYPVEIPIQSKITLVWKFWSSTQKNAKNTLFSGKIYTAGTNFTRSSIATNLISAGDLSEFCNEIHFLDIATFSDCSWWRHLWKPWPFLWVTFPTHYCCDSG